MLTSSSDELRIATAYWCNSVLGELETRFLWSWELLDETGHHISDENRALLSLVATCAPNERLAAYFAAGPLEDYIGLILEKKASDEATMILSDPALKEILPFVWQDAKALRELAHQEKFVAKKVESRYGLRSLSLREAAIFWCRGFISSLVSEDFDQAYSLVRDRIRDSNSREATLEDLYLTAPDKEALEYLDRQKLILTHL